MIAKGKFHWVLEPLALGIIFTLVSVGGKSYTVYIIANLFFGLAVLMILIFRDPPRDIGKGAVSPIDGRILHVDKTLNSVTIRAGLLHVKVARSPVSGTVLDVEEFRGRYPDSGKKGEGVVTRIATRFGTVRVIKSTRLRYTKVAPYGWSKRRLRKGQRIAGIYPVAYVSVEFPRRIQITVAEGQKVVGGVSTIARPVDLRTLRNHNTK